MSEALAIRDDSKRDVTWTPKAHVMVAEALEASALIGQVATEEQNEVCSAALAKIKGARKELETVRKLLKDPITKFGRLIDSTHEEIERPLLPEEMRLGKLSGSWLALQEAKRKAEEAARLLEQQRVEQERQAEMARVAREEEAKRRQLAAEQEEAQRKLDEAKTAQEAQAAAALGAEVRRQQELAAATSHERMEAVQEKFNAESAAIPVVEAPARAKGQTFTEDLIIDAINEWELLKARPDLVRKIEFDLVTLKKELSEGKIVRGVKFHKEPKAGVRVTNPYRDAITIGGGR